MFQNSVYSPHSKSKRKIPRLQNPENRKIPELHNFLLSLQKSRKTNICLGFFVCVCLVFVFKAVLHLTGFLMTQTLGISIYLSMKKGFSTQRSWWNSFATRLLQPPISVATYTISYLPGPKSNLCRNHWWPAFMQSHETSHLPSVSTTGALKAKEEHKPLGEETAGGRRAQDFWQKKAISEHLIIAQHWTRLAGGQVPVPVILASVPPSPSHKAPLQNPRNTADRAVRSWTEFYHALQLFPGYTCPFITEPNQDKWLEFLALIHQNKFFRSWLLD